MNEVVISIDKVTKTFGSLTALNDISTEIRAGAITGLVGPDGAGKTTLIRHLTGLMTPDTGDIKVLGYDTQTQAAAIQRSIGYMPQQFGLYEDLSIIENLNLYANLKGLKADKREETFNQLLTLTDLKRFKTRIVGKLSGGMKQKLGLACALLTKPSLLLLDEPGVGVDPISRRDLWAMVSEFASDGVAVLWSTAYLEEAAVCDHVLGLDKGELLYDGLPENLTERVKDRVFLLTTKQDKRKVLRKALTFPSVVDGVIQGSAVRLVLTKPEEVKKLTCILSDDVKIVKTKARFEDAYVDLLGGIKQRQSILAESIPEAPPYQGAVIEAQGLTKIFGNFTAADNVSFSIKRGEIFGLLGPNGAGKSTVFKMLCGLLKPTQGEGFVAGLNLRKDGSKARNQLGYMAQKFSLYSEISVRQNLDFYAGIYGLNDAEIRQQCELMIKIFDMQDIASQTTDKLSRGFKQRLSLAACLMHHPRALFLDEPTSGVDPIARREFWNHINSLAEKGITVLVTTHFMDEAEYCDRIALIYRGQAIALGSPDALKDSVASSILPEPTMEEAFIELINRSNPDHASE